MRPVLVAILLLLFVAVVVNFAGGPEREDGSTEPVNPLRVARLGRAPADPEGLAALREAFTAANPGYDLQWHPGARAVAAADVTRVVFVQSGGAHGTVAGATESDLVVGDLVVLRPGETLAVDAPLDLLAFAVPEPPGPGVPAMIRPDWDPQITDKPGGCATDPGAYRRLLLTWDPARGPYVYHKLNVHRIRADDSFTHYHPVEGGFDEFYLVQEAPPGSKFLFTHKRELLEDPSKVDRLQAADLMRRRERMRLPADRFLSTLALPSPNAPFKLFLFWLYFESLTASQISSGTFGLDFVPGLLPGDLIYIPRGVVHRGLGGLVAQIIAVPGFVPGGERAVDDALKAINERLGLRGPNRVPYHEKK